MLVDKLGRKQLAKDLHVQAVEHGEGGEARETRVADRDAATAGWQPALAQRMVWCM